MVARCGIQKGAANCLGHRAKVVRVRLLAMIGLPGY